MKYGAKTARNFLELPREDQELIYNSLSISRKK
jgi:hypothetical protein